MHWGFLKRDLSPLTPFISPTSPRLKSFSNAHDIMSLLKKQPCLVPHFLVGPCLMTNLQLEEGEAHLKLCARMFLDMFPTITPNTVGSSVPYLCLFLCCYSWSSSFSISCCKSSFHCSLFLALTVPPYFILFIYLLYLLNYWFYYYYFLIPAFLVKNRQSWSSWVVLVLWWIKKTWKRIHCDMLGKS